MSSIRLACLIVVICISSKEQIGAQIYGGTSANEQQFPFIASVQVKNRHGLLVHVCGGSILTPRLILTAVHCTESKGLHVELYRVYVGANGKSNGREFEVKLFIPHPFYNSRFLKSDLMFIELTKHMKFSSAIQPVQPNREFIKDGVGVVTAGWGNSNDNEKSLKFIEMNTVNNSVCDAKLQSASPKNLRIHDNNVCAYSGKYGHGICNGDSGGPLLYNNTLVGVLTWSYDCAVGMPEVFHRINSFTEWIDLVIEGKRLEKL